MPDNPQFLGPQDPQQLAAHILQSTGPSGPNREYLYMLNEALQSLSPESEDGHISDLASRAMTLEAKGGWEEPEQKGGVELHKVGSTEEQEEIERET
jgi:cation transport protein ChaC